MSKRTSKRVGLGNRKKELTLPKNTFKAGYIGRWINDHGGRLQEAKDSGYEHVYAKTDTHVGESVDDGNSSLGTMISKVVDKNVRKIGEPMRAYLMQIKREWYEEDQKVKIDKIEEMDKQIRRGGHGVDNGEKSNFYGNMNYKT